MNRIGSCILACGVIVSVLFAFAAQAESVPAGLGVSVRDFGAVGDGKADDRGPFQRAIDSALVSGVEIKKETVAPLVAPRLRRDIAVGRTEQEQSGSGTPASEANRIDENRRRPRSW